MKLFNKSDSKSPVTSNNTLIETRRTFLQKLGLGGLLAGLAGFGFQSFRALVPNVLYEPPQRFKIGLPANLADGVTFLEDKRLYVFKEGRSFYAISGMCTHLGCTVKYTKLNQPKQVELGGEKKTIRLNFIAPATARSFMPRAPIMPARRRSRCIGTNSKSLRMTASLWSISTARSNRIFV